MAGRPNSMPVAPDFASLMEDEAVPAPKTPMAEEDEMEDTDGELILAQVAGKIGITPEEFAEAVRSVLEKM